MEKPYYNYAVLFRDNIRPDEVRRTYYGTPETPEEFAKVVADRYEWATDVWWVEVPISEVMGGRYSNLFTK